MVSGTLTVSYTLRQAQGRLCDGDGNRVKAVVNGMTSIYVGNYFEITSGITRTYHYAGNVRVMV